MIVVISKRIFILNRPLAVLCIEFNCMLITDFLQNNQITLFKFGQFKKHHFSVRESQLHVSPPYIQTKKQFMDGNLVHKY